MRRRASARLATAAVTATKLAVERELGWLFREQPTEDYGIDAQAEVVDGEDVRGRLLALQIKGGKSWFGEPGPGGWWFRPDRAHVQYWTSHSLPVVVVLYHPEAELCYWQLVNRDTLVPTSNGGWKLLVPNDQLLDGTAREPLREAAEDDPYVLRIRELQLAKPWMERLASGQRLVVDIQEWMHKSSGRGSITLGVDNEDGRDPTPLAQWNVLIGYASYATVIPKLFAWANVDLHQETYDDAASDLYEVECSIWDEDDRFLTEDYDDWRVGRFPEGLRPYTDDGEIGYWRLELTLNNIGQAFLRIDEFATSGEHQLIA